MGIEAWWLVIIPICFALGWLASRFDVRQMMSEQKQLPDSYFKGLNFLLNEDHDKAIDAFVEVAKLDPETTELHFALGSLFRRRGEIERSIRVHQSLLARADLPKKDREQALHEIGQDYFKAGMYDRAEEAFKEVQETSYAVSATQSLIRIYEVVHDWPKAIGAVQKLATLSKMPIPQIVHYHCELAIQAMQAKEPDFHNAQKELSLASDELEKLPGSVATHVRLLMLQAQFGLATHTVPLACQAWQEILTHYPDYTGLIAEDYLKYHISIQQYSEGLQHLQDSYRTHPSIDLFSVLFRHLYNSQGAESAWQFGRESLRLHPSLLGLDKLLEIEIQAKHDASPTIPGVMVPGADLNLLYKMVHKHTKRLDGYRCSACGFQARAYYWQCPGCNQWETYPPKKVEEV